MKAKIADLRCTRGAAVIEFALLAPVLLLMVVAAIDFGTFIHQKMQLQSAARAGAQFAAQSSATRDDTTGIANAVRFASELDFTGVAIETTQFCACSDGIESTPDGNGSCGGTCAGGEFPGLYVRVDLTGSFAPLFPIKAISDLASSSGTGGVSDLLTLNGEASMRVR